MLLKKFLREPLHHDQHVGLGHAHRPDAADGGQGEIHFRHRFHLRLDLSQSVVGRVLFHEDELSPIRVIY